MGKNLLYILLGFLTVFLLLCIIYYNKETDTFTIPTKNIAPENEYRGLEYPASDSSNSISSIFNRFITNLNTPTTTNPNATTTTRATTTTLPSSLPTAGNTPETVIPYLKGQLDIITKTYFNQGIKPAIEVDTWIKNLQERLSNIQLKMIELNITPNEELVFY